jgi:hypothetical protein
MFECVLNKMDVEGELSLALILELVGGFEREGVGILVCVVEVFLSVVFEDVLDGLAADLFLEVFAFLAHAF